MHEYIPFAITIAVIITGILFNKQDLSSLRAEMLSRFDQSDKRMDRIEDRIDRIETRITVIESDLRNFYSITGKHDARIEILERDRRS